MTPKYLTPKEASEVYAICEQTLANWRNLGKGPRYFKVGRLIRYAIADFDSWVESQTKKTIDTVEAH